MSVKCILIFFKGRTDGEFVSSTGAFNPTSRPSCGSNLPEDSLPLTRRQLLPWLLVPPRASSPNWTQTTAYLTLIIGLLVIKQN